MKPLRQIIESINDNYINAGISDRQDVEEDSGASGDFGTVAEAMNYDKLHEDLIAHYNKRFEPDHLKSIKDYVSGSRKLNDYQWRKTKRSTVNNNILEKKSTRLDSVLNNNKTPKKFVVWSGTKHDPREKKNNEGIVNHPAYLSTSLDEHVAGRFAFRNETIDNKKRETHQHLLKIKIPKGHPGAYVARTGNGMEHEKEFILPRGTNLRYLKTDTTTVPRASYRFAKHIHVHHMEVV